MVRHGPPDALTPADGRTIDDVLAGLRERGGRTTLARRLLLGALFRDRRHRSAEELAAEVRDQAPDVNISTIYRNLDELARLGLVSRSYLGGRPVTYHLASASHGHLVCDQCGSTTEVPAELFRDVARRLAAEYGHTAGPHQFCITGRCAHCQANGTSPVT